MYLGALVALGIPENPDFLASSCHSIRELMEKLPRYLDLPVEVDARRMGEMVRPAVARWDIVVSSGAWNTDDPWNGEIDAQLRAFLKEAQDFFAWVKTQRPTRRAHVLRVLEELDPSGRSLPPEIAKVHATEWMDAFEFFTNVAHHRRPSTADEVQQRIAALEGFLLDRFRPRTFKDQAALDEIIREGEEDA
jgi:hypothetical protein